jgi:hypothetical protein
MDFLDHATGGGSSDKPAKGGKIRITPRQDAIAPIWKGGPRLTAPKQHTSLRNRFCPSEPKVPFKRPLKTALADEAGELLAPEEKPESHHGVLEFFKDSHKGHQRIIMFLLLPLAILLTCAVIFVILKIL